MNAVMAVRDNGYLATVRSLLADWVRYRRGWNPHIGYLSAVPWIDEVRGTIDGWTEGDDYDQRIRATQMRHVDQAIDNLPPECRHALFVVYLNEIGPTVWRSARKPMSEIKDICERAELMLVPMLRRRDVL